MKELLKNKIVISLVVIATVILAGVAAFTAFKLYEISNTNSALVPEKENLPTPSLTPTPPLTQRGNPLTFRIDENPSPTSVVKTALAANITPTATVSVSPTKTPTPTSTSIPTGVPRGGVETQTSTTPTPESSVNTKAASQNVQLSPTPGGNALPDAGFAVPSVFAFSFGIIILVLSVALAL